MMAACAGDTLFALGCGRLLEGSPEQMWRVRLLPCCAMLPLLGTPLHASLTGTTPSEAGADVQACKRCQAMVLLRRAGGAPAVRPMAVAAQTL